MSSPGISLKAIVFSFSLRFFTLLSESNSNTMFSAVLTNQSFVARLLFQNINIFLAALEEKCT